MQRLFKIKLIAFCIVQSYSYNYPQRTLHRNTHMTFNPEKEHRHLQRWNARLQKQPHIPPELLYIVNRTYTLQIDARESASIHPLAPESFASEERRSLGVPLLNREDFPYDGEQARRLVDLLITQLQESPLSEAAETMKEAIAKGELDLTAAFAAHLAADEDFFATWTNKTPQAPRLVSFLAQSSLAPSIAAGAEALAVHHASDTPWAHPHCPLCGSLPLMGELRDKEGKRYVSCSFCRHSYRIARLTCAFCGENAPEKLQYFVADGQPGYRVEVCDSCGMYLKVADFRDLDRSHVPVLDDLESLPLDILANEKGYRRPTLSGLGF